MQNLKSQQESDFGDGPESRYIVRDAKTGELQTGCFVLRPVKELGAFRALEAFFFQLELTDSRKEPILNWLKRLDVLWKLGLEDERDK